VTIIKAILSRQSNNMTSGGGVLQNEAMMQRGGTFVIGFLW